MKYSALAIPLCLAMVSASCIKTEPLNSECDIISVSLPGDVLNRQPQIENNKVTLIVKNDVSLISLAPEFELTPGASIKPPSGTARNFLFPQLYTVTSEDGEWHKQYTVIAEKNNRINLSYSFENVKTESAMGGMCTYDVFYEVNASGKEAWQWASANQAYSLTFQASTPKTFPTYQGENGVDGSCVVMVTRGTGSWGQRLGKPLASGNLFMGVFDMTDAVNHPLEATHFGMPFSNVPSFLSGYYKYKPGETYCEPDENGKLVPVPGKTDDFTLYAVFYESVPGQEWLNGNNVLAEDNPYIVSIAQIPDHHASDEWVQFSVPFVYRPGKSVDPEKLKEGKYSIAVVMGSSDDGDNFCGAIGSMLQVDEIDITCIMDSDENQ